MNIEEMIGKIYCADCLEIMKQMPDKCVDLVLTDPPYGLGIDGQKQSINLNPIHDRKAHEFMGWDKEIPSQDIFDEIFRISKNQIVWGGNYFVSRRLKKHKGWVVWDKGQHGLTMSDGELAYTSFDCPLRILTYNRVEIAKDGADHPTQKPLKLFERCVDMFSEKESIIFDPFLGSGTTAVACEKLGRKWIGCELEPKYFAIAQARVDAERAQLKLF